MIVQQATRPPPYWLWLGPVLDEAEVLSGVAVSAAANRWQRGIIGALSGVVDVEILATRPEPMWPRGPVVVRAAGIAAVSGTTCAGYVNFPGLRSWTQTRTQLGALAAIVRRRGPPSAVLSYNVTEVSAAVAAACAKRWGTRWFPVVADIPSRPAERLQFEERLRSSAGTVCLSWAVHERESGRRRALHLDGGVVTVSSVKEPPYERGAILYAGALTEYGGIDLLVRAFSRIADRSAQLWVCGKGSSPTLEKARASDPRISAMGLVPESRLVELTSNASVLANPRPPDLQASQDNFPSKVLEYLSYGKPVVSTWTPGLMPAYREHLIVSESGSVEDYAAALRRALSLDDGERSRLRAGIQRFLEAEKLWSVQATRLVEWVEKEVGA